MFKKLLTYCLPLIVLLFTKSVSATHVAGSEMTYVTTITQPGGAGNPYELKFDFTLKVYRDCGGVALGNTQEIWYDFGFIDSMAAPISGNPHYECNSCSFGGSSSVTLNRVGTPTTIDLICSAQTANCDGGGIPGYEEHIYQGSVTIQLLDLNDLSVFGAQPGKVIRFYFNNFARNNTIDNVVSPGARSLYNQLTYNARKAIKNFDDGIASVNGSPVVTQKPIFYGCINEEINFSNIAMDAEGHDIRYFLVNPLHVPNPAPTPPLSGAPYLPDELVFTAPGVSFTDPWSTAAGFNLNNATGQLNFTPQNVGEFIFSIMLVEVDSNGGVLGTTMRDYQFVIQNCAGTVTPNVSGPDFDTTTYTYRACYNEPFCFDVLGLGTGTEVNLLRYNNEIDTSLSPLTSFSIISQNADSTVGRFCWDPGTFVGTETFTITSELDVCPYKLFGTFTYTVIIDTNYLPICQDTTVYIDSNGRYVIDSTYVWDTTINNTCDISTIAIDKDTFLCADIGVNVVNVTTTFINGITRSCVSNVTVIDTISPTIVCQPATLYLDATGSLIIDTTGLLSSVTDNCSVDSVWVNTNDTLFGCVDTGTYMATIYAMDPYGNIDSCVSTLTILDTINPTLVCQPATIYLDPLGQAIIDTTGLIVSTGDNCSVDSVWVNTNDTLFSCVDTGTYNATIYVMDPSGNIDSCVSTLTILDTIAPTLVCQPATIYLDPAGQAIIDTTGLISSTGDNCSVDSVWVNTNDTLFSCAEVGLYNATIYIMDGSGNMDSCVSALTILDTINPTVICKDTTIYLDVLGNYTIDSSYIDNGSNDACGVAIITLSNYVYNCLDTGVNGITMYVFDRNGNVDSCTANVTVLDTIKPVVLCKDTTIYLDVTGNYTIDSSYIDNGSNDACGVFSITQSAFDCSHLGPNNVKLFVSDGANTDSCTSVVTVLDMIAPTISCLPATVYLDASGQAIIDTTGLINSTGDNCSVDSVWVSTNDTLLGCVDTGVYNATIYVMDGSGNMDSCVSTLTILDTINPIVICKDTTIYLDVLGNYTIDSSYIDNGSNDACGINSITLSNYTYNCLDTGVNGITMYVFDASGNVDSCTANVTVLDTIKPVVLCKDTTIYLDVTGNYTIDSSYIDNGSNDACGVFLISQSAFDCSHLGANNVKLYVSDGANTDSCTSVVTVLDTIAPTISCLPATVYLDASGQAIIDTTGLINSTGDNCSVDSVWVNINDTLLGCVDTGIYTATIYVMDGSGNMDSCISTLTILDTIAPTISCLPATVYLDAAGQATIDTTGLISSTNDNCTVDSVWVNINDTLFSCGDTGIYSATIYVMDGSGNMDSCVSTLTVLDTIAPTISCLPATVYLDAAGQATIDTTGLVNSTGDNCTVDSVWVSVNDTLFGCVDTGVYSATIYVMDGSGNMDSCVSTLTILDTINPTISCLPATLYLDATGALVIDTTGLIGSTGDNCSVDSVWVNTNDTLFSCADTGLYNATIYVLDGSGNLDSCVSSLTILDTINPAVICKDTTIYLNVAGNYTIDSSYINNGSNDACGIQSITLSQYIYTCVDTGVQNITMYVSDVNGNVDSCTANITVIDTIGPVAICLDTTIYLDASGNFTIDSSFVDGGSSDPCGVFVLSQSAFNCTHIGPNNVKLYVYDLNSNVDSCIAIVTVLDTINPVVICKDTTIYLDATGSYTIDSSYINNGSNDACGVSTITLSTTTFNCIDTGVNSLTMYVTDVNGNIDSCVANITVRDTIIPAATAGADDSLCGVYTYNLNGNTPPGTLIGTWRTFNGPNVPVYSNVNDPNANVSGLIEGTYEFIWSVSNGVGCNITEDTVGLYIYDVPVSNAGVDTGLCNTFSLGLYANTPSGLSVGTWTYVIPAPTVPVFTNANNPTTVVSNLDEGTYTFVWTVTNGNCIDAIDTMTVSVYETPVANAGADQSQCGTQDALLLANSPAGTATGLWTNVGGPNVPTIVTPTSPLSSISNLMEGTYTFVWTVSNGVCTPATDTMQLFVYDSVTSNAGVDTNLCAVYTLNLYGNQPTGTASGQWFIDPLSTPPNTPIFADSSLYNTNVSGLIEGTYTFLWITQNGNCPFAVDTIVIDVWDNPASSAGSDSSLCATYSLDLYADSIGGRSVGTWSLDPTASNPNIPTIANPNLYNTNISGLIEGVYTFVWNVTNGSCYNYTDTIQITIYDQPAAIVGPDQNLCDLPSTVINAVPLTGTSVGTWYLANGTPNIPTFNPNTSSTTVSGMVEAGTYTLYYEAVNGVCPISRDTIVINNYPVPTVDFTQDTVEICQEDCIQFTDLSIIHPAGAITNYYWTVGGMVSNMQNPQFCFPNSGDMDAELIVESDNGCRDTLFKNNFIRVNAIPIAGFQTFLVDDESSSTKIQIQDNSSFSTQYWYNLGDGDTTNVQNPSHLYADSGFYDITQIVRNDFGCADTLTQTVYVHVLLVYVPNTFTPDGSGHNETFFPVVSGDDPDEFLFRVFDRWGELLFQTQNKNQVWDGTYKGEECKTDTYVWTLRTKYKDGDRKFEYRGHVNLLR